jgi:hypothetical protein
MLPTCNVIFTEVALLAVEIQYQQPWHYQHTVVIMRGRYAYRLHVFLLNIQSLGLISGQIGVVFCKIKVTLL